MEEIQRSQPSCHKLPVSCGDEDLIMFFSHFVFKSLGFSDSVEQ